MDKKIKICVIGGGSGMPVINQGLVRAGFENIKSIVTVFDSGGDSGRMKTDERGRIMAFSDYWRSLMSLWSDGSQKDNWNEMLKFRDGRGRNFGNLFLQFMTEKAGSLSKVDSLFCKLTGADMKGEVVPVATKPADIVFRTKSGKIYKGEHKLDELRMSLDGVETMWLEPEVKANREATKTVEEAEIIIVAPGSMYGSVLINLLPKGMKQAWNMSKAKKILITNIMSVANENDNFDQVEYVNVFGKYLETKKPFDLVLMADMDKLEKEKLKEVLRFYKLEHSSPINYNRKSDTMTLVEDIAKIEESNMTLRHSAAKLEKVFRFQLSDLRYQM